MKTSFRLKTVIVKKALSEVLRQPTYILLAILAFIVMMGIILWSLNYDLIFYIFFQSPLDLFGKIEFFFYGYQNLFSTLDSLLSFSIVLFSILFGLNISLLIYVIKNHGFKNIPKKSGGSAFFVAILGGGCIACGTSLLAPILISIGVISTAALRDLGTILNLIGSMLMLYSIYKLSLLVSSKKQVK
jgi:hypothetical protein